MNNTKTTKRALLSSVIAMLLCVAMLIGTTFAWFTDSASTAVNKIQAGKLDVALEMKDNGGNWVTAEGKTLQFKVNGQIPAEGTQILWEPGCTYELPELRIVNKGNLALKYKIAITGINGDAELNRVIDWTINDADINLTEKTLEANTEDDAFVIKGHMQESAGNEYQGKYIDGIGITVYATQNTVENDSNDNTYDAAAEYQSHVVIPALNNAKLNKEGSTYKYADDNVVATVPETAVTAGQKPAVTVTPTDVPATITVNLGEQKAVSYDISMSNVTLTSADLATVSFNVGAGLNNVVIYHNNAPMTKDTNGVLADGEYTYDFVTGYATIKTSTFSPFTAVYDIDAVEISTAEELSAALNKTYTEDTTIMLTNDITLSGEWGAHGLNGSNSANLTINGNHKTIYGLTCENYINKDSAGGFNSNGLVTNIGPGFSSVTFKNLTIDGANLTNDGGNTSATGVFVGNTNTVNVTFDTCTVTGAVVNSYKWAGGFIGFTQDVYNNKSIKLINCVVSDSNINTTDSSVGGLVGQHYTNLTITGCKIMGATKIKCAEDRTGTVAKAGYLLGTATVNTTTISNITVESTVNLDTMGGTTYDTTKYVGRIAGGATVTVVTPNS